MNAVTKDQRGAEFIALAGEALLKKEDQDIPAAKKWLEAASFVPLDPRQKDLLDMMQCAALWFSGEFDEAYKFFNGANTGRDVPGEWHFLACVVYLKREPGDNPAETIREIDTAIGWAKKEYQSPSHAGLLANLYGHKAYWHLQSQQISDAEACCKIAMQLYPDYLAPLRIMAEISLKRGNAEEAIELLSESIARRTDGPRFFDFANRGKALLDVGDVKAAFADLNKARSLEPENAIVLTNLGIAADEIGNTSMAWRMYNAALLRDFGWAAAHNNRAVLSYRNGDYERADRDFTNAVLREPDGALMRFNRGVCRFQQKMYGECLADLAEAHRLGLHTWELQYLTGMCRGYLNEYATGISVLRNIVDQYPLLPTTLLSMLWNNIGTIAYRKEEYRIAHECFLKAFSTDPLNGQADSNIDRIEETMSGAEGQMPIENEVNISISRLLPVSPLDDIRLSDIASYASLAVSIASLMG